MGRTVLCTAPAGAKASAMMAKPSAKMPRSASVTSKILQLLAEHEAGHDDPVEPERVVDGEVEVVALEVRQHAGGDLHDSAEDRADPEHRVAVLDTEVRQLGGDRGDHESQQSDESGIGRSSSAEGCCQPGRRSHSPSPASMRVTADHDSTRARALRAQAGRKYSRASGAISR